MSKKLKVVIPPPSPSPSPPPSSDDDESEGEGGGGGDTDVDEDIPVSPPSMIKKDASYEAYVKLAQGKGFYERHARNLLIELSNSDLPFYRMVIHSKSKNEKYDTYTLMPGMKLCTGCVRSVEDEHILSRPNWFSVYDVADGYSKNARSNMNIAFQRAKKQDSTLQLNKHDFENVVREFIVVRPVTVLAVDSCLTMKYIEERIRNTPACGKEGKNGFISPDKMADMSKKEFNCNKEELSALRLKYPAHKFRVGVIPEKELGSYVVPIRTPDGAVDQDISVCMCKFGDVKGHASLGMPAMNVLTQKPVVDDMFHPEVFLCNPAECLIPTNKIVEIASNLM